MVRAVSPGELVQSYVRGRTVMTSDAVRRD
jgi:hypothetical protein